MRHVRNKRRNPSIVKYSARKVVFDTTIANDIYLKAVKIFSSPLFMRVSYLKRKKKCLRKLLTSLYCHLTEMKIVAEIQFALT